jgi:hypothetical protein
MKKLVSRWRNYDADTFRPKDLRICAKGIGMSSDLIEYVWQELRSELNTQRQAIEDARRTERALIADSVPSYTVAALPTAANGGLGNNASYCTIVFASNGRKSGEGAGAGTGTLCFWQASLGQWLRITDNTQVVA